MNRRRQIPARDKRDQRGFESFFLQRGVRCEPDLVPEGCLGGVWHGCEIRELLSPSWESLGCSGGPLGYREIGEVPRLEAHFVEP